MPVEELTLRTASLADVLSWLNQPKGPHLVDDMSTPDSFTALAILVTPEALYNAESLRVGLGLVYKTLVTFMQIHESSQVIPLPGVPTLFLDMKTEEDMTNSNEPWPPQDFRGFRIHKVLYLGAGTMTGLVALPHLKGETISHWTSAPT